MGIQVLIPGALSRKGILWVYIHIQNQQYSRKNAELINANGRNFQVLRNLILQKRANFALINSALIYAALIYSCINLF